MNKVGVIYNPSSGSGKNPLHDKLQRARNAAGVIFVETTSKADIVPALSQMAMRGANMLAIVGGDGTVDAVLTALRKHKPFAEEPTIAVYDGGTTNMSYLDIGYKGPQGLGNYAAKRQHTENPIVEMLKVANDGKLKTIRRSPIKVESFSLPEPLLGFFMGTLAIPRAINFTRDTYHTKGMTNAFGQALATSGMLWRLIRGNVNEDPILAPSQTIIEHDGTSRTADTVFLTLTSLERLILGMRPLAKNAENTGELALMGVTAPYSRFISNLPGLLAGRQQLEPEYNNGALNMRTNSCTLTFDGEWTLDGELFETKSETPLTVSAAEPFTFAVGVKE